MYRAKDGNIYTKKESSRQYRNRRGKSCGGGRRSLSMQKQEALGEQHKKNNRRFNLTAFIIVLVLMIAYYSGLSGSIVIIPLFAVLTYWSHDRALWVEEWINSDNENARIVRGMFVLVDVIFIFVALYTNFSADTDMMIQGGLGFIGFARVGLWIHDFLEKN